MTMMTKSDWLVLAGYLLVIAGLAHIYVPFAYIAAGLICLRLGIAAHKRGKQEPE